MKKTDIFDAGAQLCGNSTQFGFESGEHLMSVHSYVEIQHSLGLNQESMMHQTSRAVQFESSHLQFDSVL